MGVKQEYISALENGKKQNPSARTIGKIAHALGVFREELILALTNEPEKKIYNNQLITTNLNQKIRWS
jgi:transcriptional regulator with XRE-family HTH domain